MSAKLTQEEFINKAKKIHGDKDILDEVVYDGAYKKIVLICPIHGKYEMTAHSYLSGKRCPKCSGCHRHTIEERIKEAIYVHGDKYDYSKVENGKCNEKVTIICPMHGEFKQTWKSHIHGSGCPKCSGVMRKTTDDFIKEFQDKFGSFYDLSKVNYINAYTKICLICPEHGEFWATPHSLLSSETGCPKCGFNHVSEKLSYTQKDIIDKIKQIHGEKYDLSKVKYTGIFNKIELICPKHGSFLIRPHNIISGKQGCPICGKLKMGESLRKTTENFINEAHKIHGNKYDYSKVKYTKINDKICIICHEHDVITGKEHGEFWQRASDHLSGCGCPSCGKNFRYTINDYIEKASIIHNNKYDYSKLPEKFTNFSKDKITVICPKHGEFNIMPGVHLRGVGCPVCNESILEKEIACLLNENSIKYERQKRFKWLKTTKKGCMSLDFYLPDYNIAIECQGIQHFKSKEFFGGEDGLKSTMLRDSKKNKLCDEHGIKILYYTNIDLESSTYRLIKDKNKLLSEIKNKGT